MPLHPSSRALLLAVCLVGRLAAADYFVAPDGSDANAGSKEAPFASLMRAQAAASWGDTVYLRGGTYFLDNSSIARTDTLYAYVHDFTKPGIRYFAYADEVPIFDLSAVKPVALRITAFFIRTDNLHFRGFHVVGTQVTIRVGESSNTQSENFRIRNGNGNTLERLTLRDGMGIGVYIQNNSANNLVLNCDAYNNVGLDSLSIGNVDGFGSHTTAAGVGNVFRGCRAWLNSDDGFDLINCRAAAVIENCWAAFNGYLNSNLAAGGDGHGFKAGGYGRNGSALPDPMPRHVVRFSLAVRNRTSGFYANHHGGGLDFISNTAYQNATNYNMLNVLADNLTNVPGYNHYLKNNLGFSPRSASVTNLNFDASDVSYNFFTLPVNVSASDFVAVTTNTSQLFAYIATPRQADGSLPVIDLLRLTNQSPLIDQGLPVGFPYNLAAPDLGCFENNHVPPPGNLRAEPGFGKVQLLWDPVPGSVSYSAHRSIDPLGPFEPLALGLVSATFTDADAVNATTYHYAVAANNRFGSSAPSNIAAATPTASFDNWLAMYFPIESSPEILDAKADPDGDGRPNLLEYFLGSNPAAAEPSAALVLGPGPEGGLDLTFSMAKETIGIASRLESSEDLQAWSEISDSFVLQEDDGIRLLVRLPLAIEAPRAFWRLRISSSE
jgi:hypothetical protein